MDSDTDGTFLIQRCNLLPAYVTLSTDEIYNPKYVKNSDIERTCKWL